MATRPYALVHIETGPRPDGTYETLLGVECPFCGTITSTPEWELSGPGKVCARCGALHSAHISKKRTSESSP